MRQRSLDLWLKLARDPLDDEPADGDVPPQIQSDDGPAIPSAKRAPGFDQALAATAPTLAPTIRVTTRRIPPLL